MTSKNQILIGLILLSFLGCENTAKPIDFIEEPITSSYTAQIDANIVKADKNNAIANRINKTIEDSLKAYINSEKLEVSLEALLREFDTEYVTFKSNFPDSDGVWQLSLDSELLYQSEAIITVSLNIYSYTGGAHGNDKILLLNFNPKTGAVLSAGDLILDREGFMDVAKTYFMKSLDNANNNLSLEDYFFGGPFHLPENFGFSEDGLIMIYNVYEIASYAQGYTEFIIPYHAVDDKLNYL